MNRTMKLRLAFLALLGAASFDNTPFKSKQTVKVQNSKPPKTAHRPLSIFNIRGVEIEAYSRKDAIKRYIHNKKA